MTALDCNEDFAEHRIQLSAWTAAVCSRHPEISDLAPLDMCVELCSYFFFRKKLENFIRNHKNALEIENE